MVPIDALTKSASTFTVRSFEVLEFVQVILLGALLFFLLEIPAAKNKETTMNK